MGPLADRTFAAVLFDMDGTLVDSTPAVQRSWAIWAAEFGLTPEDLAQAHGIPAATTARNLIAADRVEAAIARIDEIELADLDGVVPLPGASDALDAVSDRRRAIATSCTRPLFEVRMKAAGLAHPAVTVTVDDVERGKPAPDPFLRAAELLGVDPKECLVVEDAPGGLAAAKAAGCATLAVTTTASADHLDADAAVADLSQVRFVESADGVTVRLA